MSTSKICVIVIAGPSGSGKSSLAQGLTNRLGSACSEWLELDHYYRDLRNVSPAERAKRDFDHPDALESELLVQHVSRLKRGHRVKIPQYNFTTHLRADNTRTVDPKPFIVLEGLFALCYSALLPLLDLSFFINIDDAVALQRRIQRDVVERGRTESSVVRQFESTVQPAAQKHIRPSAKFATLQLSSDSKIEENVELMLQQVKLLATTI